MTIAEQIERALDYRGDVTVSRRDGAKVIGFVYDRGPAHVELFDERGERVRLALEDITGVALTGDDAAARAQRSWERRRGRLEARETSVWGEWDERTVLILVALPLELKAVARALGTTVRAGVVRGRLGDRTAIARAIGIGGGAAHVIEAERPRLVISCGFSGGLAPSLRTGDVVLASAVRDESGDVVAAPEAALRWCRRALAAHEGELWCATRVIATPDAKRALAAPGRLAVDLESWSVARAAQRAGIPWLAVRVVLDPLDRALPAFTEPGRYAGALAHPLELAGLAWSALTATRALERALRRLPRLEERA